MEPRQSHRSLAPLSRLNLLDLVRTLGEQPFASMDLAVATWGSVVELVTQRIQIEGASLGPTEWVRCSATYLDLLAHATRAGTYSRDEALIRRLHLTGFALESARQTDVDVVLLDPHGGIDSALEVLPSDVAATASAAAQWRDLAREDVLRLRRIKNLLTPALILARRWGDARLDDWSTVYPSLP